MVEYEGIETTCFQENILLVMFGFDIAPTVGADVRAFGVTQPTDFESDYGR